MLFWAIHAVQIGFDAIIEITEHLLNTLIVSLGVSTIKIEQLLFRFIFLFSEIGECLEIEEFVPTRSSTWN